MSERDDLVRRMHEIVQQCGLLLEQHNRLLGEYELVRKRIYVLDKIQEKLESPHDRKKVAIICESNIDTIKTALVSHEYPWRR